MCTWGPKSREEEICLLFFDLPLNTYCCVDKDVVNEAIHLTSSLLYRDVFALKDRKLETPTRLQSCYVTVPGRVRCRFPLKVSYAAAPPSGARSTCRSHRKHPRHNAGYCVTWHYSRHVDSTRLAHYSRRVSPPISINVTTIVSTPCPSPLTQWVDSRAPELMVPRTRLECVYTNDGVFAKD